MKKHPLQNAAKLLIIGTAISLVGCQGQSVLITQYSALQAQNEQLTIEYEEISNSYEQHLLKIAEEIGQAEDALSSFFVITDDDTAIFKHYDAQISIDDQSSYAFVFPEQGNAENNDSTTMEALPVKTTRVYFSQDDNSLTQAYFEITLYSSANFCQSSFHALEGEESEMVTADGTTSIFVKENIVDGVLTTIYRPSGSTIIITSIVENTQQQMAVQEILQSYTQSN